MSEFSASNWVRTSDVLTKTDYESVAFDHSATDASLKIGVGGIRTHVQFKFLNNFVTDLLETIFKDVFNLTFRALYSFTYNFKDKVIDNKN